MEKILGSWSGVRKYLENEIIAESLRGRIRYNCTSYPQMDGCHIFEIFIDGKSMKQFSYETVNSYFIKSGYKSNPNPYGVSEYWDEFWDILQKFPIQKRSEFTDDEFCDALGEYRNQSIETSLVSENPIVRMFAIFDRRVGKRKLKVLLKSVESQPEWLRSFYNLRLKAENILYSTGSTDA